VEKGESERKKQAPAGDGHIVTSAGRKDAAAWGTRAEWCD
jgi:hypothetical protein